MDHQDHFENRNGPDRGRREKLDLPGELAQVRAKPAGMMFGRNRPPAARADLWWRERSPMLSRYARSFAVEAIAGLGDQLLVKGSVPCLTKPTQCRYSQHWADA